MVRPRSVKKEIVASMSRTAMPTLSSLMAISCSPRSGAGQHHCQPGSLEQRQVTPVLKETSAGGVSPARAAVPWSAQAEHNQDDANDGNDEPDGKPHAATCHETSRDQIHALPGKHSAKDQSDH